MDVIYDPEHVIHFHNVGSRVTCDPPVLDTDDDKLVLVKDINAYIEVLQEAGFYVDGSLNGGKVLGDVENLFVSFKHKDHNLNVIATQSHVFVHKFMVATHVCTKLNVLNKEHRICVFQAILYGEMY